MDHVKSLGFLGLRFGLVHQPFENILAAEEDQEEAEVKAEEDQEEAEKEAAGEEPDELAAEEEFEKDDEVCSGGDVLPEGWKESEHPEHKHVDGRPMMFYWHVDGRPPTWYKPVAGVPDNKDGPEETPMVVIDDPPVQHPPVPDNEDGAEEMVPEETQGASTSVQKA